jgi:ATP-dependent Lon protease
MIEEKFVFTELENLSSKIKSTDAMPRELATKTLMMLQRLERMAKLGHYANEFDLLSRYIELVSTVPWGKKTSDKLDLIEVKKVLDKNHYGMEDVKERILEYLSALVLLKNRGKDAIARSPVLLFVGLQGVGKTTLAISIAEALGRQFVRIAMGGIGSTIELRGKTKSLEGAEPGLIVKSLIKAQAMNPVILLDEIEKASGESGLRSDIMAVLLEILDPGQNMQFRDHYVDFPVDLSDVLFICSANSTGPLSAALLDRMEIIKMPSYSDAEKLIIARDFLLPTILEKTGLTSDELEIDPSLWPGIIRPFGFDSGIRSLGRTLESICRKVAKEIVENKTTKVVLSFDNLKKYLPK